MGPLNGSYRRITGQPHVVAEVGDEPLEAQIEASGSPNPRAEVIWGR